MGTHSKTLESTALWKAYLGDLSGDNQRSDWTHRVYDMAVEYLKDVRGTFQNYTLHDETHVLNVLDAMAGILGNQVSELKVGEKELLILAACLHDLGMVYSEDKKKRTMGNKTQVRNFLRGNAPELLGCPPEEWTEDIRQWYLRSRHPFRLLEILQDKVWKGLFSEAPMAVVSQETIIAVCQAHGETPEEFVHKKELEYLEASDVDPLFCALLLRLADLLDFDDTRAPKVLYSYVTCNARSKEEWDKHQASGGFHFPAEPSGKELPYKARCTDPGIEHTIRDFLDWIDIELNVCGKVQQKCRQDWQRDFPFPRAVLRKEIVSEGYESGDFLMTMDQARVMELLTGERLYGRDDIFIRELLQNSIDATLLRAEMDKEFSLEEARIDLWEWNDKDGNIWFRIDDQGTGMTKGMLQRYFLKIGNSYYTSKELKRDLRDHGQTEDYQAISRFGIGFLSCFLCGTYAEVSTRYFDPKKNQEESDSPGGRTVDYGLRLQVTGLEGYYTLKSQEKRHQPEEDMPAPDNYAEKIQSELEEDGYRAQPGTSIAIRLDPGRLGAIDLRETAKEYLCCAKVPVYYNGERIGRTYSEVMHAVHEMEGEKVYELTPELKEKFDKVFPRCAGKYPKLHVNVVSLSGKKNQILTNLSGALIKYDVRFEEIPQWKIKDRYYRIKETVMADPTAIGLKTESVDSESGYLEWDELVSGHPSQEIRALESVLASMSGCPATLKDLGDEWLPFASEKVTSPYVVWRAWLDMRQKSRLNIPVEALGAPTFNALIGQKGTDEGLNLFLFSYHGVVAGRRYGYTPLTMPIRLLILLDGKLCPVVNASRSTISDIPLELSIALYGILSKWLNESDDYPEISNRLKSELPTWRKLRGSQLEHWLKDNLSDQFREMIESIKQPLHTEDDDSLHISDLYWATPKDYLWSFLMAYLQDTCQMTVNYEEGQIITLSDKHTDEDPERYDLFPPMMFCSSATKESRRFICSDDNSLRRCVTADHPYTIWLLDNATLLNRYYRRQFQQITNAFGSMTSEGIIKICNEVSEQLRSLPEHHGIDMSKCPKLTEADFWIPPAEEEDASN